jgi:metal-responsive CopG/Arc/MetJ family transcriptional regulator
MVREDKLQLHVWFDRKLVGHLDRFAKKWGISRSELIRVACAQFLAEGKHPTKKGGG